MLLGRWALARRLKLPGLTWARRGREKRRKMKDERKGRAKNLA
jgi:hypothetical protein